jgi:hypothetical protein
MSAGERMFSDRVSIALRAKWLATGNTSEVLETVQMYKLKYPNRIELVDREFFRFKKRIEQEKTLTSSVNRVCLVGCESADLLTQKLVEVA